MDPIEKCTCIPRDEYEALLNHGLDEDCLPHDDDDDDDCCCHDHDCCDWHDNHADYVQTIGDFEVVHVSG